MKKVLMFLAVALLVVACKDDDPATDPDPTPNPDEEVAFTSFRFSKSLNSGMSSSNVLCDIGEDAVTGLLPGATSAKSLIPIFAGDFAKVEVNGVEQESGVTPQDFSSTVTYKLTGADGTIKEYEVTINIFTALPIVTLKTENNQLLEDKDTWINCSVDITKTPEFATGYTGAGRMKGRGNATWGYPKRPYRFKLDTKSEILGMPSNRDWVLLAEYCDKSLLRTTYANELSRLAGLPWSCRGYHVELFMNNSSGTLEYHGTYLLTEHVKDGSDRINVDNDGFAIERDGYWNQEPAYFSSSRGIYYTFKYPDGDDLTPGNGNINGDPDIAFIRNFMNEFETALYGDNFKDPATGYRKYVDVECFAKWMLVQEALGNIDTNPYFVLKNRAAGTKLQMYPVWDFEWSLGLAAPGPGGQWAQPPTVSPVDLAYWMNNGLYYGRMMEDPYFKGIVKAEWAKLKPQIPALKEKVNAEAEILQYAQVENFKRWKYDRLWGAMLFKFDTWEEEVDFAADFFDRRVAWLDGVISAF